MLQVYIVVYSVEYVCKDVLVSVHSNYASAKRSMDAEWTEDTPSDVEYKIITKGVLK